MDFLYSHLISGGWGGKIRPTVGTSHLESEASRGCPWEIRYGDEMRFGNLAPLEVSQMIKRILVGMAILLVGPGAQARDSDPPFLLSHRSETAALSRSSTAAPMTVTIPADTEVAVQLLSGIHSRVSHEGDPVQARLRQPLYVGGDIALPPGTLLDGRITRIRAARRLRRPAELALQFESVSLPDGQEEPIQAVLAALESPTPFKTRVDSEGYLKGSRSVPWKGLTGGLVTLSVFAAGKAVLAGSAALASLLPAGGVALATSAFLWPRGNDVHLPPDTRCRVRLLYPLTVRIAW